MSNISIWLIDRTLSRATTLGQSGPWSKCNLRTSPHSPRFQRYWSLAIRLLSVESRTITGGRMSYHSAEIMQSVYSTAAADCTNDNPRWKLAESNKRWNNSEEMFLFIRIFLFIYIYIYIYIYILIKKRQGRHIDNGDFLGFAFIGSIMNV